MNQHFLRCSLSFLFIFFLPPGEKGKKREKGENKKVPYTPSRGAIFTSSNKKKKKKKGEKKGRGGKQRVVGKRGRWR